MSNLTILRIFWGSLGAIAAGLAVLAIAAGLGFATTGFTWRGPDIVGVQPTSTTWLAASVGIIAVLALFGGALGQFVAWVGALVNTAQLQDKVWFLVLLLLGLVGLGFVPMLVYVLAGPDATARVAPVQQAPVQQGTAELPKAA
jgi:H+/Cl- antiporter ClcA